MEKKVAELQFGITKSSDIGSLSCQCKTKQIELNETDKISIMLKEVIKTAKEGKAKIKIEIEFQE